MKKRTVWKSILADVLVALLCLTGFAYIRYVRPHSEKKVPVVNLQESMETYLNEVTEHDLVNPIRSSTVTFRKTNIDADIRLLKHYFSDDEQVMTDTYQIKQVRKNQKEVFFVTDVYTTDVKKLQTAFSQDTYGKSFRDLPIDMMRCHNGVIGISGDNYGESDGGICVRNGHWYCTEQNSSDVCVLFYDGTMEIYAPQDFEKAEMRAKDVWQAWSFGPSLLDVNGEVAEIFNTTDYILNRNPRCAIGYVEPGHYLMIVVDGREDDYSQGLDLPEFAQLCKELGCTKAYNLDGGKTATMMTSDQLINKPCEGMNETGGRPMSDIIFVAEE